MEQQHHKRIRRASHEIQKLLEEFNYSGITAKEFCVLHNITEAGFYKWRARYVNKSPKRKTGFVLLKAPSSSLSESTLFAEVRGIRIYQVVTASYLKELLA